MVEQERHDERILAVMGEGVVTTEPNVAQVVLGVVTEDENLSVAQRQMLILSIRLFKL